MQRIRLKRSVWEYDTKDPLGPEGGFGEVFSGIGKGKEPVAVKKLKFEARQLSHREMRVAEELFDRELLHVIPILDAGQDADSDSYFVVMACAEKSLQDELNQKITWDGKSAAEILLQLAKGLAELPDITHRDLKPGNALYHEGKWKVADFGIARFIEDSTSLRTLKDCLTAPYAAPEQWRSRPSSKATDIYSLGCIGYALLTGNPPFLGPGRAEFQEQHLHQTPPELANEHDPRLRSLLAMMLRKSPEARPNLKRVQESLSKIAQGIDDPPLNGTAILAQLGAVAANKEAEKEAAQELEQSKRQARIELAIEATRTLCQIIDRMFNDILQDAPTAIRKKETKGIHTPSGPFTFPDAVSFGDASLQVRFRDPNQAFPENAFSASNWNVVTGASIQVLQHAPPYVRGSSLWYADVNGDDDYRWREVSYFSPLSSSSWDEPFMLDEVEHADLAAAPSVDIFEIAFGPKLIDDEDEEDFSIRWRGFLAKGYEGKLCRPRTFPLQ